MHPRLRVQIFIKMTLILTYDYAVKTVEVKWFLTEIYLQEKFP